MPAYTISSPMNLRLRLKLEKTKTDAHDVSVFENFTRVKMFFKNKVMKKMINSRLYIDVVYTESTVDQQNIDYSYL